MNTQTPAQTPIINTEIIWRQLDDNAVIVSPRSGEVRVLNAVGTIIWRMLTDNHSVPEIVDHLADNYQVMPIQAEQDVVLFLQELHDRGLIQWPTANA